MRSWVQFLTVPTGKRKLYVKLIRQKIYSESPDDLCVKSTSFNRSFWLSHVLEIIIFVMSAVWVRDIPRLVALFGFPGADCPLLSVKHPV
jgi:hypothetical protein